MRSASHRLTEAELDDSTTAEDMRWSTLRAASRVTGIPVETLRKWARRGSIPSYLSPSRHGTTLRMVDLDAVRQRATALGRDDTPDLHPRTADQPSSQPPASPITAPIIPEAPPGSMIVPIDAWNKMLNQLGNLHEAGQQLATARERAAKAETEVTFLRERLAELRQQQPPNEQPATQQLEAQRSQPAAPPARQMVWRYVVGRWRDRRWG